MLGIWSCVSNVGPDLHSLTRQSRSASGSCFARELVGVLLFLRFWLQWWIPWSCLELLAQVMYLLNFNSSNFKIVAPRLTFSTE